MKPQRIGDITVNRLVEVEGPLFDAAVLLPDSSPEAFRAQANWLAPQFYDLEGDNMLMSIHAFVVRTPHHTILIDTCCGNDKNRPARPDFSMLDGPFLENLQGLGVAPEAVDFVMCTHLHFDHVGWNTRLDDGEWVPTFPNAKYLFSRADVDHFENMDPDGNHSESYRDSVLPVIAAGQAVVIDSDHALDDTVWIEPAPGHTPGNYCVRVASGDTGAVFSGDVLHHPVQCAHPEWSSRACIDPDQSRITRAAFLDNYAETDTTVFAAHFPGPTAGTVVTGGENLRFRLRGD